MRLYVAILLLLMLPSLSCTQVQSLEGKAALRMLGKENRISPQYLGIRQTILTDTAISFVHNWENNLSLQITLKNWSLRESLSGERYVYGKTRINELHLDSTRLNIHELASTDTIASVDLYVSNSQKCKAWVITASPEPSRCTVCDYRKMFIVLQTLGSTKLYELTLDPVFDVSAAEMDGKLVIVMAKNTEGVHKYGPNLQTGQAYLFTIDGILLYDTQSQTYETVENLR